MSSINSSQARRQSQSSTNLASMSEKELASSRQPLLNMDHSLAHTSLNFIYKVAACIVPETHYGIGDPDDSVRVRGPEIRNDSTSTFTFADDPKGPLAQPPNGRIPRVIPCLGNLNWGTLKAQFTCYYETMADVFHHIQLNTTKHGQVIHDSYHKVTNIEIESKMRFREAGDPEQWTLVDEESGRRMTGVRDDNKNVFLCVNVTCEHGDVKEVWVLYLKKVVKGKILRLSNGERERLGLMNKDQSRIREFIQWGRKS